MADQYIKAKKLADKEIHKAVLKGEYPYVKALDDIVQATDIAKRTNLGVMEIPADYIVGTKTRGRQNMFASNFMPAADHDTEFAMKWTNLYNYQEEHGVQDPILVYEYKHLFYVQEGNKRVSVFKFLEVPTITADVIRIESAEKDDLYEEFLAFYRCTGLYELYFTEKGSYKKLAKLLGKTLDEKWDETFVRSVKGAYYIFQKAFKKRADEDSQSCSDAFLIFLNVYGLDDIRKADRSSLDQKIVKIWNEVVTSSEEKPIQLMDKPEEKKEPVIDFSKIIPVKKVKIGFVYDSDPEISSSVYEHELGRILVSERYRDKITTVSYPHGNAAVLEKAVKENDVIFTTSPLLLEETFRLAIKYSGKKFFNCSLYQKQNAVRTYEVRMFEAKFLLGALAATFCDNHTLGYIADYPVYGTIANINAFAIGAAMIDPDMKIYLGWSETLDKDWQDQMQRLNIKVFCGPELPSFEKDNIEYGIYRFTDNGVVNLAAPVVHWGNYYEKLIKNLLDNQLDSPKDKAVNYWWGMASAVLDVTVSQRLPYPSRKLIQLLKNGLIHQTLNPFEGELHSQEGLIQEANAGRLSNEDIITMDWLNDNIIGIIPQYHQLTTIGKEMTEISGVKK